MKKLNFKCMGNVPAIRSENGEKLVVGLPRKDGYQIYTSFAASEIYLNDSTTVSTLSNDLVLCEILNKPIQFNFSMAKTYDDRLVVMGSLVEDSNSNNCSSFGDRLWLSSASNPIDIMLNVSIKPLNISLESTNTTHYLNIYLTRDNGLTFRIGIKWNQTTGTYQMIATLATNLQMPNINGQFIDVKDEFQYYDPDLYSRIAAQAEQALEISESVKNTVESINVANLISI